MEGVSMKNGSATNENSYKKLQSKIEPRVEAMFLKTGFFITIAMMILSSGMWENRGEKVVKMLSDPYGYLLAAWDFLFGQLLYVWSILYVARWILGPLLISVFIGAMTAFIVFIDSEIPGVVPPSPFSPPRAGSRGKTYSLNYVMAFISGIMTFTVLMLDFPDLFE